MKPYTDFWYLLSAIKVKYSFFFFSGTVVLGSLFSVNESDCFGNSQDY